MNIGEFVGASINGIALLPVVLGLVEWFKEMGVKGKQLRVVSMLIGLILGVLYHITQMAQFGWGELFGAVIFGLTLGLAASGIYDAAGGIVKKAAGQ